MYVCVSKRYSLQRQRVRIKMLRTTNVDILWNTHGHLALTWLLQV